MGHRDNKTRKKGLDPMSALLLLLLILIGLACFIAILFPVGSTRPK